MNIIVCDVCRAGGRLVIGVMKARVRQGKLSIAIDVCRDHKDVFRGMTFDQARVCAEELRLT